VDEDGMSGSNPSRNHEPSLTTQVLLCVGALGLLVLLMFWTYNYPSVSGQPTKLSSFLGFWLREFLLLAFFAFAIAVAIVGWLLRLIRRACTNRP
jgi:hypothetical protein